MNEITGAINNKLEAVEGEIEKIDNHPNSSAAIHSFLQKQHAAMEREENSLRAALRKMRRRKSETRPPTSSKPAGTEGNEGTTPGPSNTAPTQTQKGRNPPSGKA